MIPTFLVAAAFVLPVEFVVDCTAGVPPGARGQEFEFSYRFVCHDGAEVGSEMSVTQGARGQPLVWALTSQMGRNGWSFETLGGPDEATVFVVRGSKTSPVKSVEFKGDWKPLVTRRLATRQPPGPKK